MSIERRFSIPFISQLALREKQSQQTYRPTIAVHKWFARRPGTLYRGLILSEFVEGDLSEIYYGSHQLDGIRIADPFMGGGSPLVEANRLGCDVVGYDINPMAWWIVSRTIEHLDLEAYKQAADELIATLEDDVGSLYRTECIACNSDQAHVKSFLWVMTQACTDCGHQIDLFPGFLISENKRHPLNVILCGGCGELNEVVDRKAPGDCGVCQAPLTTEGPARRGSISCPKCQTENAFPDPESGPPRHRMFAMEYHCFDCKPTHKGRFFKVPSPGDLERYAEAERRLAGTDPQFIPDDPIPAGDESTRLHRWGYDYYRHLFNARQLLGLELSCRLIAAQPDERIRNALATNLSDMLRYNNMLVRYDTMALKALDTFSIHGFPTGLVRAEVNLLGLADQRGRSIGSGGWTNMVEKYLAAKQFCDAPFEVRQKGNRRERVYPPGEWIGDRLNGGVQRVVDLRCGTATTANLEPESLDAVFTDPPYYDSLQYAELMDFCYAWLRRLAPEATGCFQTNTTRNPDELTGNRTKGRDLEHFTAGLSEVYRRMSRALKPGRPLAFTYHHNRQEAYYPIAVAILDSGLTCSASLPCPAEMGGSIHISGTGSSIVDTVFVCRSEGEVPARWITDSPAGIAAIVSEDLALLRGGGVKPSKGDTRCITFGHLTRLAIWYLRDTWDPSLPVADKLARVAEAMDRLAKIEEILELVQEIGLRTSGPQPDLFHGEAVDEDHAAAGTVPIRSVLRAGAG